MENNKSFIYYKDDFIDSDEIIDSLLEIKKSQNFTTNYDSWSDRSLVPTDVGIIKKWEVDDSKILDYFCNRLPLFFEEVRSSNLVFEIEVTEWQSGAFLPFHDDGIYYCAATCYLDSSVDHGGEFLCKPFDDQSLGMFLETKFNRIVLVKNVKHAVTKIHNGKRTTLQMWGRKINADL